MAKFRQQAQSLPTANSQSYPNNTYPNNYQPQQTSSYYTTQYQPPAGAPPTKPPQTYQPSSAYQYGGNAEHGYEYQQAEENRRMEEAEGRAEDLPPPQYDAVANNRTNSNSEYGPFAGYLRTQLTLRSPL